MSEGQRQAVVVWEVGGLWMIQLFGDPRSLLVGNCSGYVGLIKEERK